MSKLDHLAILRFHADKLGLGDKGGVTFQDYEALIKSLKDCGQHDLSTYISNLSGTNELEDLLVNFIYADDGEE